MKFVHADYIFETFKLTVLFIISFYGQICNEHVSRLVFIIFKFNTFSGKDIHSC